MPRNQGTSRKGKPGKKDRASGMGRSLQKSQGQRYRPRSDGKNQHGDGGMERTLGVESIGMEEPDDHLKTRSVLELQDLDDFLLQADMANREFVSEREGIVVVDDTMQAYKKSAVQWEDQKPEFTFKELSVPRRPEWNESTTPAELDVKERQSFLEWRRAIAQKEEELLSASSSVSSTPFEKNIEVWRQLWRVMERSSCLLQLVDARNPMFYLSSDLRDYAKSLGKPMMVLVNKSDYLSSEQRYTWREYLVEQGWDPVFFSAVSEQKKLDAQYRERRRREAGEEINPFEDYADESEAYAAEIEPESQDGVGVDTPLTRMQLMETMLSFARKHGCQPDPRYDGRIQMGFIGFPNVGKSSVINVLVGSSKHEHGVHRVGVASQPGKTKHFQTLFLPDSDEMMLCDCPGLVFPSFVSNTADLIAAGVFPIAQMRDHWPVTKLICQRIPRELINAHYGITLPVPSELEMNERGLTIVPPPTAEEFLDTFCVARSLLAAASGVPDYTRASRMVIKDYADGKLLYCHPPPNLVELEDFFAETTVTSLKNTERLQKQLLKAKQRQEAEAIEEASVEGEATNDDRDLIDDDILELLGGPAAQTNEPSVKKGRNRNQQKWGKKNRKHRNKDPYGCHSNPDDTMSSAPRSAGVVVNAGKHGRKGYTRPVGYGNGRGVSAS